MHELSIARSILDIVIEEMETKNISGVKSIGLKIGQMSDILPDSLEFGFDALKQETELSDTVLKIEQIPAKGRCNSCANIFEIENLMFECPACHSASITMEEGQELDIAYIETSD